MCAKKFPGALLSPAGMAQTTRSVLSLSDAVPRAICRVLTAKSVRKLRQSWFWGGCVCFLCNPGACMGVGAALLSDVSSDDLRSRSHRKRPCEAGTKLCKAVKTELRMEKIMLDLSESDLILTDDFLFPVHFPELRGGYALFLFEDAVEVRQRVESAFEADFGHGLR